MFQRFFSRADGFYHRQQLEAFFVWLAAKSFADPFFVLVDLPLQKERLTLQGTPSKHEGQCGFIVCGTNKRPAAALALHGSDREESWCRIWYAEGIEIWENAAIHQGTLPLRFGIPQSEKEEMLRFARENMEAFFDEKRVVREPAIAPQRLGESAVVDVALWIAGEMRGSIISSPVPLLEALRYASRQALRDPRMKPVEQDEVANARIEITFMSDLILPLREEDMNARIDACKGYYVEESGQKGWYLPAVFNCLKFRDMNDLKRSLVIEKAKISRSQDQVPLQAFQVEGWIEGEGSTVMLLEGPVAYAPILAAGDFLKRVRFHADETAEWLLGTIDSHGALPLYKDPLTERQGRIDWVRLAHASYALAAFATTTQDKRCLDASATIARYVERYVFDTRSPRPSVPMGAITYLAHAALERADIEPQLIQLVETHSENAPFEPIAHAVLASLFARLTLKGEGGYQEKSISLAGNVFTDFAEKRAEAATQLASYPELIYTYALLHELTGDSRYLQRSEEVASWLIDQQLPHGPFPLKRDSAFVYTRGTSKIFETLALHAKRYQKPIEASFNWLLRMQYQGPGLYFVRPDYRDTMRGAFRHDHADSRAWIDSTSHFLLGASRLLAKNRVGITSRGQDR